jgi:hypothetical protein
MERIAEPLPSAATDEFCQLQSGPPSGTPVDTPSNRHLLSPTNFDPGPRANTEGNLWLKATA